MPPRLIDACELQSALGKAVTGDKIWVAAGAYKPTGGTDRAVSFQLVAGVAVYGGFPGSGDPGFADRNWETYVTVLSGDIAGNDLTDLHGVIADSANITAINSYHGVISSGLTDTAVLDGFTISGGHPSGRDLHGHGGGIYNDNSSPTLTNLTFSGNRAHYDGGMANYHNSNPAQANVTFSNNSTWGHGGGMYSSFSTPVLTGVDFTRNSSSYLGGGMGNWSSNPVLTNVAFTGNSAHDDGGTASWGPMTITNSTVSGNYADGAGGGIANWELSLLANCTISHNSAGSFGGGVSNHGGQLAFSHCTITGNTADADADENGSGGGIVSGFYADPGPGLVLVKNTIIAGNERDTGSPASGPDIYEEYPAFESLGYNLIGNGEGATGFVDGVQDEQVGSKVTPLIQPTA